MKNSKAKEILVPTISLFLICLVVTLLLAVTNKVTAPKIEELQIELQNKTKMEVLSTAKSFSDGKIAKLNGVDYTYYIGKDADKTVGYVFSTFAKGYGGDITLMVGVNLEGEVMGIDFLSISETAGLGMNADTPKFKEQFVGKHQGINVNKNNPNDNEIKALTGATITSKAVTQAVNDALMLYEEVKDNG